MLVKGCVRVGIKVCGVNGRVCVPRGLRQGWRDRVRVGQQRVGFGSQGDK